MFCLTVHVCVLFLLWDSVCLCADCPAGPQTKIDHKFSYNFKQFWFVFIVFVAVVVVVSFSVLP